MLTILHWVQAILMIPVIILLSAFIVRLTGWILGETACDETKVTFTLILSFFNLIGSCVIFSKL